MIYVRVELWPGGDRSRSEVLGEGRIALGRTTNGGRRGNYAFSLTGKSGARMNSGFVEGFPRKTHMAWDLLYRVLRSARGYRNEGDRR